MLVWRASTARAGPVGGGARLLVSGVGRAAQHLDIPARERFEQALASFEETILAVAHDRYFLARFAERVLALRDGRLIDSPGRYDAFLRANGLP